VYCDEIKEDWQCDLTFGHTVEILQHILAVGFISSGRYTMAFYVIPPTGVVGMALLEEWTCKRARFLREIYDSQHNMAAVKQAMESDKAGSDYCDCLIEGTTKDAISHFALR
jgi:hypothetical protein